MATNITGKNKFSWEHIALVALGGAAVVSSGLLMVQWKHAQVGRRVTGDVLDFLQMCDAKVQGKFIVGGPVTVPMKIDDCIVSTVDTMIKDFHDRALVAKENQQKHHIKRRAESVAAGQMSAQRFDPPAHYDGPNAPPGGEEFRNKPLPESLIDSRTGKPVGQGQTAHAADEPADSNVEPMAGTIAPAIGASHRRGVVVSENGTFDLPDGAREAGGSGQGEAGQDFSYAPPQAMAPPTGQVMFDD